MKKGTHGYTICECKKRAWGIHANGRCTSCITASELIDLVYPDRKEEQKAKPEEPKKKLSKPTVAQLREKFAAQREAKR